MPSPVASNVTNLLPLRFRVFNAVIPVPTKEVRLPFVKVTEVTLVLLLRLSVVSAGKEFPCVTTKGTRRLLFERFNPIT